MLSGFGPKVSLVLTMIAVSGTAVAADHVRARNVGNVAPAKPCNKPACGAEATKPAAGGCECCASDQVAKQRRRCGAGDGATPEGRSVGSDRSIRIEIYCPTDSVITINHQITQSTGTFRQFESRVTDDTPHFYRIQAKTRDSKGSEHPFEGDFSLKGTDRLKIYFDPRASNTTLVWNNGVVLCPECMRSNCKNCLPLDDLATEP